MITLEQHTSESWFSERGARIKKRRLIAAGVPNLKNWRFLTLTVALRGITPEEAYELGKDRLRRFMARFRKALGFSFRWCWKLEFHHDEEGYAHWHVLIEYKERIPQELLPDLEKWWGLGRVNVRRVNGTDILYVFKYVSKGLEDLPDWVRRYKGRMRVFQTSQGFWTKKKPRKHEKKEQRSCMVRVDLITRERWDARKAAIVTTNSEGRRLCRVVKLPFTFLRALLIAANQAIRRCVPLVAPGVIEITEGQKLDIIYEHRKYSGLAGIPPNAFAA